MGNNSSSNDGGCHDISGGNSVNWDNYTPGPVSTAACNGASIGAASGAAGGLATGGFGGAAMGAVGGAVTGAVAGAMNELQQQSRL
jgi:hypothetical protein